VIRERRAEASLPPTSYRGPSAAIPDRPPNRKSVSYDLSRHSIEVAARTTSASEPQSRRLTEPSPVERYEAEAEAYQRKRGASDIQDLRSHSLTAEALRKVPKERPLEARSETNSSQKSRNSSSKGSSGAKTGQSNSEIMMRINGIAVGIPGDSGQRITIQSKGVNISVGGKGRGSEKEYASSRAGRTPSVASRTSKTSSSREKEKRVERGDVRRVVRDDEPRTPDRAGRRSQSISRYGSRNDEDEPIGYGAWWNPETVQPGILLHDLWFCFSTFLETTKVPLEDKIRSMLLVVLVFEYIFCTLSGVNMGHLNENCFATLPKAPKSCSPLFRAL
jgi:hypothetical protein